MFESAEIGHAIDKDTYDAEVPALREALLEVQYELQQQKRFPVIVLINGIEGAGKGETVKLLSEWMDPRLIEVRTFDQQTDEELARPPAWRYWRQLPAKGRMGIFFGNWYSQMLQGRVHGQIKDARLDQAIAGAERLEKMLCDEGATQGPGRRPAAQLAHQPAGLATVRDLRQVRALWRTCAASHQP